MVVNPLWPAILLPDIGFNSAIHAEIMSGILRKVNYLPHILRNKISKLPKSKSKS